MKRIIIICEGQTERDFCKEVLTPYLWQYGITIQTPLIKISGGGIVKWDYFIEIEKNLKEYILGTYNLTETSSDHIQIMFDNKQENRIKIGNEWVFFPTVYDPILPFVIKNIGTIKVKKSLLNTRSLLTCQVSTESTCNVFYIYTDEIPKEK